MIYITSIKTGYVEKPIFNNRPYQTHKRGRWEEMGESCKVILQGD
jgi:hypothetical protein